MLFTDRLLDLSDSFFDSLRADYSGFSDWVNRKAEEAAYVCRTDGKLSALLYLKLEEPGEDYSDIAPPLPRARRLKVGTFKVALNGQRLGERFLKVVFDNALEQGVDEVYVTTFMKREEQQRLAQLLGEFGFKHHGDKTGPDGTEAVLVRDFRPAVVRGTPALSFPYFSLESTAYLAAIRPDYHTELLPDSILRTESPSEYVDNAPHRNAIRKVFISRSLERDLRPGDIVFFYRTGGYHKSVVTTVGIVESVVTGIVDAGDFILLCRRRSVFTDKQLLEWWNYNPRMRPFIVNFLYAYSLPRRLNMKRLIELGIIADVNSAPRGFHPIPREQAETILMESEAHESIAVD